MNKNYYIGLDVHKDSIAIAYALEGSRADATYHGSCGGTNLAAERALRKLAEKLGVTLQDLKVCYEAGPTGFVLARRLLQLKVECVVMSPSKTERKPNERIKTDKRDAKKIARMFRNGDIVEVRIPPLSMKPSVICVGPAPTPPTTCPAPSNASNSFLLRNGFRYDQKTKWTDARMRTLMQRALRQADPALYKTIHPKIWRLGWNTDIRHVGKGDTAIGYLARYIRQLLAWKPPVLTEPIPSPKVPCCPHCQGQLKQIITWHRNKAPPYGLHRATPLHA